MITVIYPGSFDPVHLGHVSLADYVSRLPQVDEVWFLPSRRNPFKQHEVRAADQHRLEMLRLAVEGHHALKVHDLEFHLPYPSYTVNTLRELIKRYPERRFRLLIGSDNWEKFDRWREAQTILTDFGVLIYPRKGSAVTMELPANVSLLTDAPHFPFSSTEVRQRLAQGGDISTIINARVEEYIKANNLYSNNK